jgi:hypothetical protein
VALNGKSAAALAAGRYLDTASAGTTAHLVEAFRRGLSAVGYDEGRNVTIEYRWSDGDYEKLPALAAELVRRQVTVIATINTPTILAAKAADANNTDCLCRWRRSNKVWPRQKPEPSRWKSNGLDPTQHRDGRQARAAVARARACGQIDRGAY